MTRPPLQRGELEALDRDALVAKAEAASVAGARRLTKPELVDELLKRDGSPEAKKARGLLGMARDLLSRVIERGLHLPDAAERLRTSAAKPPSVRTGPSRSPEAVPTVTLAEIYAAQGHRDKAVRTLEQVISNDPQNPTAISLLARLKDASVPLPPPVPPEPEEEAQGSSSVATTQASTESKVEEPSSMLDAGEPLPPRYDVDECVAMPVDPTTIYVYWEIREETLALCRKESKDGSVALRVLVIVPSWDGPKVASRDIDVHSAPGQSAVGDWFLRELPEGAVVRVAVGWRSNESGFVPAAHTYAVEPTPETRSPIVADLLVRWTPWGIESASGHDPKALEIARAMALQEVRRHAIGAMAREAASALGLRPLPEGIGGSSDRWQRPLGSSELHPIA